MPESFNNGFDFEQDELHLTLKVLDKDFIIQEEIYEYSSLIWTDRYNSYGDFELVLKMDENVFDYIQKGWYLYLEQSEHVMMIEDYEVISDEEVGDTITITGVSLEIILERRIAWGQYILDGNLQENILFLIRSSITAPSIAERKISNFIYTTSTDSRITEFTVDTQFTGDDLYYIISHLCQMNELGFKIILNDSNQFVFSLYVGENRSYSQEINPYVVFSKNFNNIINSNFYTTDSTYRNVAFIAGEGEGAERKTVSIGDTSGLERRELFVDARDISSQIDGGTMPEDQYNEQLLIRGLLDLSDHLPQDIFDGDIDTSEVYVYGRDFQLGDIVQIEDDYGNNTETRVTEIIFSQNESGVNVYPSFQAL